MFYIGVYNTICYTIHSKPHWLLQYDLKLATQYAVLLESRRSRNTWRIFRNVWTTWWIALFCWCSFCRNHSQQSYNKKLKARSHLPFFPDCECIFIAESGLYRSQWKCWHLIFYRDAADEKVEYQFCVIATKINQSQSAKRKKHSVSEPWPRKLSWKLSNMLWWFCDFCQWISKCSYRSLFSFLAMIFEAYLKT